MEARDDEREAATAHLRAYCECYGGVGPDLCPLHHPSPVRDGGAVMEARDDERRMPAPTRLFVDDLGYAWQDGATEPNPDGTPSALSMARTTTRNLPSTGLIEYRPVKHEPSCLSLTNSDQSDVCDCRTIRLLQFLDLMPAQETDRKHPEPEITDEMVERAAMSLTGLRKSQWEEARADAAGGTDYYLDAARTALEAALRAPVGEGEQG